MRKNTIYAALNEVRMYGGVERNIVLLNAAVVVLAVVGLRWWWVLVPAIIFHFIMRNINKKDPMTMRIYLRYAQQGHRYDPRPHRLQEKTTQRPLGFSRGALC